MKDEEIWWHFRLFNAFYKQNTTKTYTKGCNLSLLNKGDFGITKNDKDIALTTTIDKVYNDPLFRHGVEKILWNNLNTFSKNQS